MKFPLTALVAGCVLIAVPSQAGNMRVTPSLQWSAGAEDCAKYAHSPLEVRQYDSMTFILRENLCDTWEAPFMYLLVGNKKVLLIDTGDVADPKTIPLAERVQAIVLGTGQGKLPLLVVHSHGHLDHRAGDGQFANLPDVQLVPSDLDHVKQFFGFKDWPEGTAELDLGGRIVDVLPAPGHHPAQVLYYDRNTGVLFSGDFLLPGRILVDDLAAYRASAARVAAFAKDRQMSEVLGGHIEKDKSGKLLAWQSTYHPDEAPLGLTKAELLALPEALGKFNGFYSVTGDLVVENPLHNLEALGAAVLLALAGLGYGVYRLIRRWRRGRVRSA